MSHQVPAIPNLITQVQQNSSADEEEYDGGISARREKSDDTEDSYTYNRRPSFFQRVFCCFGGTSGGTDGYDLTPLPPGSPQALLPDQDPEHRGRKCLILDLDETLVHSSFKQTAKPDFIIPVEIDGHTYNVFVSKRPGVDKFMQTMSQYFEIVVFTASLAKYADPVLDILDKYKVVRWRLFRDACTYCKGNYVKDLSKIGRDLKHTLIIDNSEASFVFHPEYAILIGNYFDDPSDTELAELTPFLIYLSKCDDVRVPLRLWSSGKRDFYPKDVV